MPESKIKVREPLCKEMPCFLQNTQQEPMRVGRFTVHYLQRLCMGEEGKAPRRFVGGEEILSLPPWCPRWKSEVKHYALEGPLRWRGEDHPNEEDYTGRETLALNRTAWAFYETMELFERTGYVEELAFENNLAYIRWTLGLAELPGEGDILRVDHGIRAYAFLLSESGMALRPVLFDPRLAWN